MSSHPSPLVQDVSEMVGDHMDEILKLFKPGKKITVLVRNPDKPDYSQDFVLTNDDLRSAADALLARANPDVPSQKGSV